MTFLILHILSTTSFGLLIKHHQASGRNLLAIGAVNYAVAALAAALSVYAGDKYELNSVTWIFGILGGVAYVVSYFLITQAITGSGISVTWAAIRLSVLLPILFSIFYWNEHPTAYQIAGIGFACLSLPLLSVNPNAHGGESTFTRASVLIVVLFLTNGGSNLAAKAFSEFGVESQRQAYLATLFGTAALVSCLALVVRRAWPKAMDVALGVVLGLCNLAGAHFLLRALARLPGIVVFPISGSMGIVLTTVAGVAIWRETTRALKIAGIVAAVIAVVLINIV